MKGQISTDKSTPARCRSDKLICIGLAAGLYAMTNPAIAGFLPGFTGWTEMYDCPPCDSTINFAVWQSEGGDGWGNDAIFSGLAVNDLPGGGNVALDSNYVYLYQVVNTDNDRGRLTDLLPPPLQGNVPEEPLADLQILNRGSSQMFSSGGFLSAVFADANPVLGDANGNYTITNPDYAGDNYSMAGMDPPMDDPAPDAFPDPPRNQTPSSDGQPSSSGVTGVGLVAAGANQTVAPDAVSLLTGVDLDFDMVTDVLAVSFDWTSENFLPGATSPVLFLTSNAAPTYDWASTRSYNTAFGDPDNPWGSPDLRLPPILFGANGDLPTGMPVPATLALIGLGVLGMRRRR